MGFSTTSRPGTSVLTPVVCTNATRPTSPPTGLRIYETDSKRIFMYTGSAWQLISGNLPRCRAARAAVQSIPNSADTIVALTAEDFDTDNIHDNVTNNSRLTVPAEMGGLWGYSYCCSWAAAGGTTAIPVINFVTHSVTGGQFSRHTNDVTSAIGPDNSGSGAIPAIAGSYFNLYATQFSGAALNAFTQTAIDYFMIWFIGPVL